MICIIRNIYIYLSLSAVMEDSRGCRGSSEKVNRDSKVPIGNGNFDHHVGEDILEMVPSLTVES